MTPMEAARAVADAVLYEGYVLYPYRAGSAKNQVRWQWGVLMPPDVLALDAGGPTTRQALEQGAVDVGLLFTTDPDIPARHLVVLADDRGLQPAENITPLLRRDVIARYGPNLVAVLNRVSALLDTATLRALDARVERAGQNPRLVAGSWLRARGLIPAREDAR